MKSIITFISIILILFSCLSCRSTDQFTPGQPITPDELASISEAFFSTEAPDPSDTDSFVETYPDAPYYPSNIVHWTENGSVYHSDHTCHHLKNAENIYHGTVENATLAGKEKPCSSCEKHSP